MPASSLELLTYYLIAINLVAFAAFGIDKALVFVAVLWWFL